MMEESNKSRFNFLVVAINGTPNTRTGFHDILSACNYRVTMCEAYSEAAEILVKKEQIFNILVVGVNDPDQDTFLFLKYVRSGYNLPSIVVSMDSSRKSVCLAIQSGCCNYLSPGAFREAANTMWQHAFRHVIRFPPRHRAMDTGTGDSTGEVVPAEEIDQPPSSTMSQPKKRRVVWSDELCHDFQKAVDQLGFHKAVPKKILEVMIRKHPYLTRENIASHLQKYREQLNKEQRAMRNGDHHQIRETRQNGNVEYQALSLFGDNHALMSNSVPFDTWDCDFDSIYNTLIAVGDQIPDHPHHDFAQNQLLQ